MTEPRRRQENRTRRLIGAFSRAGPAGRTASRRRSEAHSCVGLIGRDVSQAPARRRTRWIAPILAAVLLSALFLVGLRTEVLRLRYALGNALAEEQRLSEQKRNLTVAMRRLRDPALLARRARELGFERPARVIHLDERTFAPCESAAGPTAVEPSP